MGLGGISFHSTLISFAGSGEITVLAGEGTGTVLCEVCTLGMTVTSIRRAVVEFAPVADAARAKPNTNKVVGNSGLHLRGEMRTEARDKAPNRMSPPPGRRAF